jgi:hypothetical protein
MTTQAVVPEAVAVPSAGRGFVDWGAVAAGGVMAAALSFVLLTFGSAIGLSFVSPWPGAGASAGVVASIAVFWVVASQIGAAMVGGYIAGRMRSRWHETSEDEIEFRDGLHGGLVWAASVIIGSGLLLVAAGAITRTGADVANRALSGVAVSPDTDGYHVDVLLRTIVTPAGATADAAKAANQTPAAPLSPDARRELVGIVAASLARGSLLETDRSYLAGIVAQRTGVTPQIADQRVTALITDATRQTLDAANRARRAAVVTGFVSAASLLLALAACWWAALTGGRHRDDAIPARFPLARDRWPSKLFAPHRR